MFDSRHHGHCTPRSSGGKGRGHERLGRGDEWADQDTAAERLGRLGRGSTWANQDAVAGRGQRLGMEQGHERLGWAARGSLRRSSTAIAGHRQRGTAWNLIVGSCPRATPPASNPLTGSIVEM